MCMAANSVVEAPIEIRKQEGGPVAPPQERKHWNDDKIVFTQCSGLSSIRYPLLEAGDMPFQEMPWEASTTTPLDRNPISFIE